MERRAAMFLRLVLGLIVLGSAGCSSAKLSKAVQVTGLPGFPSVLKEIVVGDNPMWVVVRPDGQYAYVTNSRSNTVTIIRCSDFSVAGTLGVKNGPVGLAISPNGKLLYVANRGTRDISVFTLPDHSSAGTISLEYEPDTVVFTPDGRYALITHPVATFVSVIKTENRTIASMVPLMGNPTGIAVDSAGGIAYVGTDHMRENLNILKIGPSGFFVDATLALSGQPLHLTLGPDDRTLYVTNYGTDNIALVDTVEKQERGRIDVQEGPVTLSVVPGGRYAYVTNHISNSVTVVNLSDAGVVGVLGLSASPWGIAFTPDAKYALVANYENIMPEQRETYRNSIGRNQAEISPAFRSNTVTVLMTNDYH